MIHSNICEPLFQTLIVSSVISENQLYSSYSRKIYHAEAFFSKIWPVNSWKIFSTNSE